MVENGTVPWTRIDFVLLDLDGTLLDKHFDDYFWEEFLPQNYADLRGIPFDEASATLRAAYKEHEGKLIWTDLYYWSNRFGLDIPRLKESIADRVRVHDGVLPFLQALKQRGTPIVLLTNAHSTAVQIKLAKTPLTPYFNDMISADQVGFPKEEIGFWEKARQRFNFNKERSLFVDDNETVLKTAQAFGIKHLLYKAYASSQIPPKDSKQFPSIHSFSETMPAIG